MGHASLRAMASTRPPLPLAAVILAAGKGTRMKSPKAKVLHEACGRPLAWFPIRRALELGADRVVVVVGHQAEEVERALRAALPGAPLRFALQREQLGTAHAVLAAKEALADHDGQVLILSGDTPLLTTGTLRAVVEAKGARPVAFATMTLAEPFGYGRVVRAKGKVSRVVEEKDATPAQRRIREVNAGLYCADAPFLWKALAKVDARNAQNEFYLTDLVSAAARGKGAVPVEVAPEEAAGVNDRAQLAAVARVLTSRIADRLMRAGVTLEDPARFDCDEEIEVGADAVLEPGVRLRGRTRIGAGCRIGQGSILQDAVLGDDVTVRPYTLLEEATVGAGSILGPFARLRPGSVLAEGVHVGNFVETKKARLGKGSKANHLTYLGDAVVGAGVNVGAGTITCNYDGEKKHETRIGDGAFIGSDSILVAPIEIGAGAYVAAGSTLTKPVPDGALALGRARQENKEGWAARMQAARARAKGTPGGGDRGPAGV
jgi:bifunctional UDP-N-acetylglucosamine pyrophosphorylase/glucosamine-1-phosphate N-acetyltransferase